MKVRKLKDSAVKKKSILLKINKIQRYPKQSCYNTVVHLQVPSSDNLKYYLFLHFGNYKYVSSFYINSARLSGTIISILKRGVYANFKGYKAKKQHKIMNAIIDGIE